MSDHDHRAAVEEAINEVSDRTARQLADCIEFLEKNLRAMADDDGPTGCVHRPDLLARLGPNLFGVVAFYTGLTMHLIDEIQITHRSVGSPGADTIIDDTLNAARHAAALQVDATERTLRANANKQLGGAL